MKLMLRATVLAAFSLGSVAGTAQAAKCKLAGTWNDSYGAVIQFANNRKGKASISLICAKPYKTVVSNYTGKSFDVTGTPKDPSCPAISASMTFQGGCDSASGTIDVVGFGNFDDTWTRAAKRAPAAMPGLSAGMR